MAAHHVWQVFIDAPDHVHCLVCVLLHASALAEGHKLELDGAKFGQRGDPADALTDVQVRLGSLVIEPDIVVAEGCRQSMRSMSVARLAARSTPLASVARSSWWFLTRNVTTNACKLAAKWNDYS